MRRLTLKSEALVDLTAEELTGVAGGASALCPTHQATLCHLCYIDPEIFTVHGCTW